MPQLLHQTSFVDRSNLLRYGLGRKFQPGRAPGDEGVTRGHTSRVRREWDDHRQLGEVIDAVVGQYDHGPRLPDLDTQCGIESREDNVTAPGAAHASLRRREWPTLRRRSAPLRPA